jgi:SulP family sulfate permease
MIAPLEAKTASLWSRKQSPGALPRGVVVYSVDGALFFGAAQKLERTLAHIQRPATILILPMSRVPFVHANARAGVIRQLGSDNTTATLALAIERVKAIETVKEPWIRIANRCRSTPQ